MAKRVIRPMTLEEHIAAGKLLKEQDRQLRELFMRLEEYPRTGRHITKSRKALWRALENNNEIRCWMEELFVKDCPEEWADRKLPTEVYYGFSKVEP